MLIQTGVMLTFMIICAVIALIDIQKQKIYNEAVAALLVPAIVSFFVFPEVSPASRVLGAVSVSGIMLFVCLIKPGAFGGGDIKLMVSVGLFLGHERTLTAAVLAVFAGGLWGTVMLLTAAFRGQKGVGKVTIPFGPALCVGTMLSMLLG